MKYGLAIIVMALSISCSSTATNQNETQEMKSKGASRSFDMIPEPDIVERLKAQRASIDDLVSRKELQLQVLVQEPGKEGLTVVANEQWPDEVITTFNIWKNTENQTVLIGEYPFSESGDWAIGYNHYFDSNNRTYLFVRHTMFYNSLCTQDLANETIINFYNSDFIKIETEYLLKDDLGNDLKAEDCDFNYDYQFEIVNNLKKYLAKIRYNE